jgi:thioredoxin reductase (NADPH)
MDDTIAKVRIYGTRGSTAAYALRDFLHRCDVPFRWIELQNGEQARSDAQVEGLDDARLPVCIFADGTRLERPTIRKVTEKLGWFQNPSRTEYDLCIYGAGPAGLTAAVYGASEGLRTVVVERLAVGGQAATSPKIENYLGFPEGISGADLAERARQQACRFGAEILLLREGVPADFQPGRGTVALDDGGRLIAHASLCATGMDYRRLNLPNEERLQGVGVYYGAGASEAELCGRQAVTVVGGGNSAGQAALHFARSQARVTMVVRDATLKATLSEYLAERIRAAPQIEVLLSTEVTALHGERELRAVTLRDKRSGKTWTAETSWLFLCLGGVPHTPWAPKVGIRCDAAGYVMTGPDLAKPGDGATPWSLDRAPYHLETNIPGVFAAGDVRHGSIKRFASAVGEGAMAVSLVHQYLARV